VKFDFKKVGTSPKDISLGDGDLLVEKFNSINICSQFFQIEDAAGIYWLNDINYRHLAFVKNENSYICVGRTNYKPPEKDQIGGRSNYYDFIHLDDDDKDFLHNYGFDYLDI